MLRKGLKVLLVVGGFPTEDNPARCIFNYRAAELLSRRHQVKVVFFRMWRPGKALLTREERPGFEVLHLSLPAHPKFINLKLLSFSRLGGIVLKKELKEADIIHSVGANSMGVVGSYLSRVFNKPHVAQLIGSDMNSVLPVIGKKRMIRGWVKNVDGISANSRAILEEFRKLYPEASFEHEVNYRGVDTSKFVRSQKDATSVNILFLGGLPDYPDLPHKENTKGGQSLMIIWSELEKNFPDESKIKLFFGGPGSDKPEVQEWHQKLQRPENVEVLGNLDPQQVLVLMKKAHVVLIPSKEEGTPNVGFEALGSGAALVGSNVGGVPELIADGVNGRILDPDDEEEWISVLQELLQDVSMIRRMGIKSRELAVEKFEAGLFEERLSRLYQKLVEKRATQNI